MPKSILDNAITFDNTAEDVSFDINGELVLPGIVQFDDTNILEVPVVPLRLDTIQHCPRCHKPLVPAKAVNGGESVSFLECPECGTLINTFKPTAYQTSFLRRRERYKMTAGGYGSGKSRADIEDVIKHILLIPHARVGVTARTYPALEATFIKEFYSMFPEKLIRRKNDQKHEIELTNGSEILFRSFDDPLKLKSMNLTMAVIVEASDVSYDAFKMVQSRIRNTAAMIPEIDANGAPVMEWDAASHAYKIKYRIDVRHVDLETNPDSGWVKTDFLLDAEVVEFFGDAYNEGYRYHKDRDPYKYVQVVSTSANPHLPPTYEEEQTRGKSKAYIQQFYKGSFNFSSNLVFPNLGLCVVPPHALPRAFNEEGRRVLFFLIGLDYGINDPTHVMFSAFSTETRKLYVYDELRLNNSDVKTIAKAYRQQIRINGTDLRGLLMMPRFDGRSYNKRESDLISIGGMFEAEGLFFEPCFASHESRIIKLNALINHDQIEIYSTCEFFINEGLNYKFKLDKGGNATKVPVDGNDHGVTGLEFSIVELPHNLKELKLSAYIPTGTEFAHDKKINAIIKKKGPIYDPLSEGYNDRNNSGYSHNITCIDYGAANAAYSIFDDEQGEDQSDEDENEPRTLGAYIPRGA